SAARFSPGPPGRSTMTARPPAARTRRTVASPRPLAPPVTRATVESVIRTGVSSRSVPQQLPGDDQALDLVGALEDLGHLGLAHEPLDREVLGVAVAAEHLHRVGGDLHRRVG